MFGGIWSSGNNMDVHVKGENGIEHWHDIALIISVIAKAKIDVCKLNKLIIIFALNINRLFNRQLLTWFFQQDNI